MPAVPQAAWFTFAEVAEIIGMSERFVEKLYDCGRISGHSHSAGAGVRCVRKVPREWVVAYLAGTADYEPQDLADALELAALTLPVEHRRHLAQRMLNNASGPLAAALSR